MVRIRALELSGLIGRSLVVGASYAAACLLTGVLLTLAGAPHPGTNKGIEALPVLIAQGSLIGMVLGALAPEIRASHWRHILILGSVLFFNSLSVAIEGMFFAPSLAATTLPWIIVEELVVAAAIGMLVLRLFSPSYESIGWKDVQPDRSRFSWTWRFAVSTFSYLASYFVFGAVNYALVTKPYYEAHAGGLVVPSPQMVLAAESVRAPLIVLSVLPLLLSVRWSPPRRMIVVGLVLFIIGGIVPLLGEVNTLPLFLLVASGWEIFFQNVTTGLVTGWLLGNDMPTASSVPVQSVQVSI